MDVAAAYDVLTAPRSILLVRTDRIGDAVITTPLIRLLRRTFPTARIDIVLGAKNASVAPLLPDLDGRYVVRTPLGRVSSTLHQLRSARYDIAINLLLKPSASAGIVTRAVRARLTIGFGSHGTQGWDIQIGAEEPTTHVVCATSRVLSLFGIPPIGTEPTSEVERLSLAIPQSALTRGSNLLHGFAPSAVLNVSASNPGRRMGAQWCADLCRQAIERGIRPFVAGAPGDEIRIRAIAEASGAEPVSPSDSLANFAGLLHAADVVVTPDSSIVHIAGAVRRPTVALFHAVETMQAWGPWGVPSASFAHARSIDDISIEHVADAVARLACEIRRADSSPSTA